MVRNALRMVRTVLEIKRTCLCVGPASNVTLPLESDLLESLLGLTHVQILENHRSGVIRPRPLFTSINDNFLLVECQIFDLLTAPAVRECEINLNIDILRVAVSVDSLR